VCALPSRFCVMIHFLIASVVSTNVDTDQLLALRVVASSWACTTRWCPTVARSTTLVCPNDSYLDCDSDGNVIGIELYQESLSGSMATELALLTALESLLLSQNHLKSTLPSQIGLLSELTNLDVSYNDLSGTIPQQWSNLNSLEQIRINGNSLQGSVDFIDDLPYLVMCTVGDLYISTNCFSPPCPPNCICGDSLAPMCTMSTTAMPTPQPTPFPPPTTTTTTTTPTTTTTTTTVTTAASVAPSGSPPSPATVKSVGSVGWTSAHTAQVGGV
jgi:hypothetical protein